MCHMPWLCLTALWVMQCERHFQSAAAKHVPLTPTDMSIPVDKMKPIQVQRSRFSWFFVFLQHCKQCDV